MDRGLMTYYGMARAAINLPYGSKICQFVPSETLPFINGEITSNTIEISDSGVDASGTHYSSKVLLGHCIPAEWRREGTGQTTPPDIRRGHRVKLYRVGDSDKWYWEDAGLDDNLMKLQTVRHVISNNPDESVNELGDHNTYYEEMSTHTGTWTKRTSKSNGEKFGYTEQIQAKEGKLVREDDAGNGQVMDSNKNQHRLFNANGSMIDITGDDITLACKGNLLFKGKNLISIIEQLIAMSSKTLTLKNLTTTVTATTTYTVGSANLIFNGKTNQNGPLFVAGPVIFAPGVGGAGGFTNNGTMTNNGTLTNTGQMTNNGNFTGNGVVNASILLQNGVPAFFWSV